MTNYLISICDCRGCGQLQSAISKRSSSTNSLCRKGACAGPKYRGARKSDRKDVCLLTGVGRGGPAGAGGTRDATNNTNINILLIKIVKNLLFTRP